MGDDDDGGAPLRRLGPRRGCRRSRPCRSSPTVGSSSASTAGSRASTVARASSRCWEAGSSAGWVPAGPGQPDGGQRGAGAWPPPVRPEQPAGVRSCTSRRTVRSKSWSRGCWNSRPTGPPPFRRGLRRCSSPRIRTVPAAGRSRPLKWRSSVDFPAPLGPVIATVSPRPYGRGPGRPGPAPGRRRRRRDSRKRSAPISRTGRGPGQAAAASRQADPGLSPSRRLAGRGGRAAARRAGRNRTRPLPRRGITTPVAASPAASRASSPGAPRPR